MKKIVSMLYFAALLYLFWLVFNHEHEVDWCSTPADFGSAPREIGNVPRSKYSWLDLHARKPVWNYKSS